MFRKLLLVDAVMIIQYHQNNSAYRIEKSFSLLVW